MVSFLRIFYTEMSHQCQECRTKDNLNDNDNDNDYINNNQSINQSIIYLFIHVTSGELNRKKLNIIIIIIQTEKWLAEIGVKCRLESLQRACLLGTARILRKVFDT